MYIYERLIGVIIYSGITFLMFMLIKNTEITLKRLFNFYILCLALMAFMFVPHTTTDLYRTYETLTMFSHYDFGEFYRTFVVGSTIPTARILFWIIAKTGVNRLLPVVTSVICYKCFFYIITKSAEYGNINRQSTALTTLFLMSVGQFMSVISNIRTPLAIALICVCFFRESVEKKYNPLHLLIYFFAATIHNIAVLLIVLRAICYVVIEADNAVKKILVSMTLLVGTVTIVFLNTRFFNEILGKASEYVTGKMYSYSWEYLIGALICIVIWVTYLHTKSVGSINMTESHSFNTCLSISLAIAIVFCFEFSIFFRIVGGILPILFIPKLMESLEDCGNKRLTFNHVAIGGKYSSLNNAIVLMSFVILLINCTRGSMCSLKFFVL